MSKIFVSYRHKDTLMRAGRIADALGYHFGIGNLFQDRAKLHGGADWQKAINQALKDCLVMVVVIGPQWLTQRNALGGRRIDDEIDYVRIEVAEALDREEVAVIPVLVGGAQRLYGDQLPPTLKALTYIEPLVIEDEDWHGDIEKLFVSIKRCNVNMDKIGWRNVTSLTLSLIASAAISPDYPSVPAQVVTIILGAIAVGLSLWSYRDFSSGPAKAKNWSVGTAIFASLALMAGLGEILPD